MTASCCAESDSKSGKEFLVNQRWRNDYIRQVWPLGAGKDRSLRPETEEMSRESEFYGSKK